MNRYPASYAHGSFGLNGHLYADGTLNQANASNTVTIDNRSIEPTYREGRDAYHLATGGSLGRVHKGMTLIRLDGRIVAPLTSQEATVSDRERAMLAAFENGEHFPQPDLLICSAGAVCDDFSAIAQRLEQMGFPIVWWEVPRRRPPEPHVR